MLLVCPRALQNACSSRLEKNDGTRGTCIRRIFRSQKARALPPKRTKTAALATPSASCTATAHDAGYRGVVVASHKARFEYPAATVCALAALAADSAKSKWSSRASHATPTRVTQLPRRRRVPSARLLPRSEVVRPLFFRSRGVEEEVRTCR